MAWTSRNLALNAVARVKDGLTTPRQIADALGLLRTDGKVPDHVYSALKAAEDAGLLEREKAPINGKAGARQHVYRMAK